MAQKDELTDPLKMGVLVSLMVAIAVVVLLRPFLPTAMVLVLALVVFVLALLVAVEISVYPD